MHRPPAGRTAITAALVAATLLAAGPGRAGMDLSRLDDENRLLLDQMLIDILSGMPDLLADPRLGDRAQPTPVDLYAEDIAHDLGQIETHGEALFAPTLPGFGTPAAPRVIALFVRADCPDCARAEADLRVLARTRDLRVTLIDIDRNAALARALDLDTAPSYVLPDMMLRGHIPPVVLERYLDRQAVTAPRAP